MENQLALRNRGFNVPSVCLSNFWDDLWKDFSDMDALWSGTSGSVPCDIIQNKDENGKVKSTEFKYALAGYDEKDVSITVDNNEMTIRVDKSEETNEEDKSKTYVKKGLARRSMQWSYVLNGRVDKDNISASFKNGILDVNVPMLPEKEVKKIEVRKMD